VGMIQTDSNSKDRLLQSVAAVMYTFNALSEASYSGDEHQ